MLIIVKDSSPRGQTRTKTDKELVDAGWGSSFKSEEDADKAAYIERKLKKHYGADDSTVRAADVNKIK